MNVLVTGSSGWLGRCLVPRLEQEGHRVIGLDPVPGVSTRKTSSMPSTATMTPGTGCGSPA